MTFVKERKQFRRPIAEFGGLQGMLADMAVALNAARLSLHRTPTRCSEPGIPRRR
jgi:3-sulfinopropanoyl-CoA desulfinase